MAAAPPSQSLRPNASDNPVSPASVINPEPSAFPAVHGPHPGQALSLPTWTPAEGSSVVFLLLPWLHACTLHSSPEGPQGDHVLPVLKTLKGLPIALPEQAKVLAKMCHLSVPNSSHSLHCSLHSSHTSLCHPLKISTLLLPQGLHTCCFLCQLATGLTNLFFQVCPQILSSVSPLTTQSENTALPQVLPAPFPGFIYFLIAQ